MNLLSRYAQSNQKSYCWNTPQEFQGRLAQNEWQGSNFRNELNILRNQILAPPTRSMAEVQEYQPKRVMNYQPPAPSQYPLNSEVYQSYPPSQPAYPPQQNQQVNLVPPYTPPVKIERHVISAQGREVLKTYQFLDLNIQKERFNKKSMEKLNGLPAYFTKEDIEMNNKGLVKHIVVSKKEVERLMKDPEVLKKLKLVYGEKPISCVVTGSAKPYQHDKHKSLNLYQTEKDVAMHMTGGTDGVFLLDETRTYNHVGEVLFTNGLHTRKYSENWYGSYGGNLAEVGGSEKVKYGYTGIEIVRNYMKGKEWSKLPNGQKINFGKEVGSTTMFEPPTSNQKKGFADVLRLRNYRKLLEQNKSPYTQKRVINLSDSFSIVHTPSTKKTNGGMHSDYAIFAPEITDFCRIAPHEMKVKCKKMTGSDNPQTIRYFTERQKELIARRDEWLESIRALDPGFTSDNLAVHENRRPTRSATLQEKKAFRKERFKNLLQGEKLRNEIASTNIYQQLDPNHLLVMQDRSIQLRGVDNKKLAEILEPKLEGFYVWSAQSNRFQLAQWVQTPYGSRYSKSAIKMVPRGEYRDMHTRKRILINDGDRIYISDKHIRWAKQQRQS